MKDNYKEMTPELFQIAVDYSKEFIEWAEKQSSFTSHQLSTTGVCMALQKALSEKLESERLARLDVLISIRRFISMISDSELAGIQKKSYYLACRHFKYEIEKQIKEISEKP